MLTFIAQNYKTNEKLIQDELGLKTNLMDFFSSPDPKTITEKIETSILLDCIFSERDSKDRQIAILHYVDGYTLEETSQKMKMSVSGVRKRLEKLKEYAGGRYGNSN